MDIKTAETALADARSRVNILSRDARTHRAALAIAIQTFQSAFEPKTALEQSREFTRTSQAERLAVANGTAPRGGGNNTPTPGPSVLDRSLAYGKDNSADGYARSKMRTGHRRGSLPSSQKGRQF